MTTNKNCIVRLSQYKNALNRLKILGFVRVFSDNLADAIGVAATQVRKDFSLFGIPGNRRGGYLIDDLITSLNIILGKNKIQKVIVVGVGNIGRALMNYKGFALEGIQIAAGFDINSAKGTLPNNIPVYPLDKIADFVKEEDISIGIIAVPDIAAQSVADTMIASGIKGILNFAPIRLQVSEEIVVNNVNLGLELETVIYFVNAAEKQKRKSK